MKDVYISQAAFEELEQALPMEDRFCSKGIPDNMVFSSPLSAERICIRMNKNKMTPSKTAVIEAATKALDRAYGLDDYQRDILHTYKPSRAANHALGVAGELSEAAELLQQSDGTLAPADAYEFVHAARVAGRICDTVKKAEYHKRAIDLPALKNELGDVLWYVTALAIDYGFDLSDVARRNITKLKLRYPKGFVQGGGNR